MKHQVGAVLVVVTYLVQPGAAAEFCGTDVKAEMRGIIDDAEDTTDQDDEEKTWLLYPEEPVESTCLSEFIFGEGPIPNECEPGAKFSLSGHTGSHPDDTSLYIDKIDCDNSGIDERERADRRKKLNEEK